MKLIIFNKTLIILKSTNLIPVYCKTKLESNWGLDNKTKSFLQVPFSKH